MSELDEAGRALLALASDAHDPTDRDRARVRAALSARLGAAAGLGIGATVGLAATAKATVAGATGVGSTSTATAAVTASALAAKLVVAVAITATVGVGATVKLVRRAPHTPAAVTSQAELVAPEAPAAPPPIDLPPRPEAAPQIGPAARPTTVQIAPADARAVPTHRSTPSATAGGPACGPGRSGDDTGPRRSEFTVADEARLVRDGVRALREGQAACALSLLDTHARFYPQGVLEEEREAERALALADLGRVAEARATAVAFLRRHPASPLGARLRQRIPGLER